MKYKYKCKDRHKKKSLEWLYLGSVSKWNASEKGASREK